MPHFTRIVTFLSLLIALALLTGAMALSQPPAPPRPAARAAVDRSSVPIVQTSNDADRHRRQPPADHHKNRTGAKHPHKTTIDMGQAIQLLHKIHPQLADQIAKLNQKNPKKARAVLLHHYHWVRWLLQLKKHDPQMYKLRVRDIVCVCQSHTLAKQILRLGQANKKQADKHAAKKQAALKAKLRKVLEQEFDVRQTMRQHELSRLQTQIEHIQKQLKSQAKRKNQLIQKRMHQLLHRLARRHHKKPTASHAKNK